MQVIDEASPFVRYGHDLTFLAQKGAFTPLVGAEAVVNHVFQVLLRRQKTTSKCNPVLIDADGTTQWLVVAEVIRQIAAGEAPAQLHIQKVIYLDYEALMTNLSEYTYKPRKPIEPFAFDLAELDPDKPESWEILDALFRWPDLEAWVAPNIVLERLQSIFIAMREADGRVLLFVDQIHRLLMGAYDACNLLKPTLARGQIQLIGTCTLANYQHYIERDAAMQRRFQEVMIPDKEICI